MSGRPIVLPELPEPFMELHSDIAPAVRACWSQQMHAYARTAIEADRTGIVVTDEDVRAAIAAHDSMLPHKYREEYFRAALESFAARKRGET